MPYHVTKVAACSAHRPWAVVAQNGRLMGCHATRAEANAQLAALHANDPHAERERRDRD